MNFVTITSASSVLHPRLRRCCVGVLCVALVAGCGNGGPESARTKLAQLGMTYSPSALVKAARDGDLVAVSLFLKAGMSANTQLETERGPVSVLHGAVDGRNKEIVELLLDKGANLNATAFGKDTPLHVALGRTNSSLALVQLLVKHGANMNAAREGGGTPLMQAVIAGNLEVIDLLLSKGADVNAKDTDGFTALIFAASDGNTPVVKALLKFKPDLEAKGGPSQKTALETARARGHEAVVETLRVAGAVSITEQYLARLQESHEEVLPSAVAGAAARVQDNGGDDTASMEVIRVFYRGKLLDDWKNQGMSPRQLAAMLLSSAAGIEKGGAGVLSLIAGFSDSAAWTNDARVGFIHKAARESWEAFTQQLKAAASADPKAVNIRDAQERTALKWAVLKHDLELAKWLVEQGADPVVTKADVQSLKGRWLRKDGGYVIEIRQVDASGQVDAGYFNPNPIRVVGANATKDGVALKVYLELNDVNYPGCKYDLTYIPERRQLVGTYFQATTQKTYEVAFEREP